MHRSSPPEDLSDELAAQHPRPILWHPQVVEQNNPTFDTLLIKGNNNFAGFIYTSIGTRADGLVFNRSVTDVTPSHRGDMVCMSGGFSGSRCAAQVIVTGWIEPDYRPDANAPTGMVIDHWVHGLVLAQGINGHILAGNGDSGGPVYAPLTVGPHGMAIAKGILERIDPGGEGPCPGVPTSPTRACSSFVKYVDMAPTLQRYHAAIVFGPYVLSAKDLQCIKQWPYC